MGIIQDDHNPGRRITITAADINIGLWDDGDGTPPYRAAYVNACRLTGREHAHLDDDTLRAEAIAEARRGEA